MKWPKSLFWRFLLRSLSVRRAQGALAMGSLVVGAAVTSMLFNLHGDARRKMTQEFRAYGANVLVAPRSTGSALAATGSQELGGEMPESALSRLEPMARRLPGLAAAPLLYVVAHLGPAANTPRRPEFQNAVVVGTDFAALRRLSPSWHVEGKDGALDPASCAIGAQVAARLRLSIGDRLAIETLGQTSRPNPPRREFRVASLVTTGAAEDNQVFVPLAELQSLAGSEGSVSVVELSVPGGAAEIEGVVHELAAALPDLTVRPVRQMVYSESRVLGILGALTAWLGTLILAIMALCVAATMTAIALERRRDIALMKALGAGDRTVLELFLGEAAFLGLAGGVAGFALGGLAAHHLALRLFGVTLRLVWWTLPVVCLVSVLVALVAASLPVRLIRGVQPAAVLKGE